MCKYGGCKDNMAKTFDDGFTLGVDNPKPRFFDISKVFRPADRIAYTLGMAKAASDYQEIIKEAAATYGAECGSAALAAKMGITAPLWITADGPWSAPHVVAQLKIASALIAFEDELAKDDVPSPHDRAFMACVQPMRDDAPDIQHGHFKLAHVMSALAAEKCMLPLGSFIRLLTDSDNVKSAADAVAARLPGVYNRLATDPTLENDLRYNLYMPTGAAPRRVRHWTMKHASEWSLDRQCVAQRLQLSTLRSPTPPPGRKPLMKVAAAASTDAMAKEYALYQLGFLAANAGDDDAEFMQKMAVRSNFVRS